MSPIQSPVLLEMLSLMEKEAAKRETGKGHSEYRGRAVIMEIEAAKKQMKEERRQAEAEEVNIIEAEPLSEAEAELLPQQ